MIAAPVAVHDEEPEGTAATLHFTPAGGRPMDDEGIV
jgi:hypothetical protein